MKESKDLDDDEEERSTTTSDDDDANNSCNEALCELLGISSLDVISNNNNNNNNEHGSLSEEECLHKNAQSVEELINQIDDDYIKDIIQKYNIKNEYESTSVCIFPEELNVPSEIMRRITNEVVYCTDKVKNVNRTYETIQIQCKDGIQEHRRVLTRLENLNDHLEWNLLCNNYIQRIISITLGQLMVLFKTKLNIKPSGGNGFAPHADGPSLRIALGEEGPQNFVTVMIAIDDMTIDNGCLRVVKGIWNEKNNPPPLIEPEKDGNPDGNGRAGAIPLNIANNEMSFDNLCCTGGTIIAFNDYIPHRSSINKSNFSRRAVFLTYNPLVQGDCHDLYYKKMDELRNNWKEKIGLNKNNTLSADEQLELDALGTIPRI